MDRGEPKLRLAEPRSLDAGEPNAHVPSVQFGVGQLGALLSVVIVDVVLAGDNAIVVGMAAATLPVAERRRIVSLGVAAAIVLRILFAYFAVQLLAVIGLSLAGGILLLWVAWKTLRELRQARAAAPGLPRPPCLGGASLRRQGTVPVFARIVLADASMSLDNLLAVAGIARNDFWVLAFGLVLSVALMGVASTYVARLLDRFFWISWIGLGIVAFVAVRMIWDGSTAMLAQFPALG